MFEVIELGGMKTTKAKSAANHTYMVDCSGSMYSDLPKIRQQLKNIISVVAQPDDTFTVIWFSGKGQCGVVFENVLVSDLSTVSMLHSAIDKWLKPMGLTGFVDPLNLAKTIAFDKTKVNNLVMLTDGWDNQSTKQDILKCVQNLKTNFHSVTFIEYGYYADRELLAKMAEETGGIHIFAEGYTQYERVFNEVISGTVRVNNISVPVNKRAKHCIFVYGKQIRIVPVTDGYVTVPEDTTKIYSVVPKDILSKQLSAEHLYLVLYYASRTNNDELVWKCLQALGDVALVEAYQNAFTKQELSNFEALVENAVFNFDARFVKGVDLQAVPKKDAKTILDLLNALAGEASLVTSSKLWEYNSTSRARVVEEETLPKFVKSVLNTNVPLKGIVFNSSRPNISISTNVSGKVILPENDYGLEEVPSYITRNYTLIRDGIRNVDKLPVVIPKNLYNDLTEQGFIHRKLIEETSESVFVVYDLTKLPVINRSSVDNVTLDDFVATVSIIEQTKPLLKALKWKMSERDEYNLKTVGMTETYGEDAAKWLSSIGVRDYGFNPVGTTSAEVSDEYEAVEVDYKIKGLSSLPAIQKVLDKVAQNEEATKKGGKVKTLTISESIMYHAYNVVMLLNQEQCEKAFTEMTELKRENEMKLAKMVYALVLGRKWFGDEEEVVVEIGLNKEKSQMTLTKKRKSIKI